jgi:hypothetical protein
MAKKYAVLRLKMPKPEGGFLESFEIGLADLGCWGDQYFDASGYPYPDRFVPLCMTGEPQRRF